MLQCCYCPMLLSTRTPFQLEDISAFAFGTLTMFAYLCVTEQPLMKIHILFVAVNWERSVTRIMQFHAGTAPVMSEIAISSWATCYGGQCTCCNAHKRTLHKFCSIKFLKCAHNVAVAKLYNHDFKCALHHKAKPDLMKCMSQCLHEVGIANTPHSTQQSAHPARNPNINYANMAWTSSKDRPLVSGTLLLTYSTATAHMAPKKAKMPAAPHWTLAKSKNCPTAKLQTQWAVIAKDIAFPAWTWKLSSPVHKLPCV